MKHTKKKWSRKLKRMILSALALTALLVAVIAIPAYASNGLAAYISAQIRQGAIGIFTFLIIIVPALVYFFSRARHGNERGLWSTAIVFTLLCALSIGSIWYMEMKRSPDEGIGENLRMIHDESDIKDLMESQTTAARQAGSPLPLFIPTGVFVQSVEFVNGNNVVLTGYIWQRYSKQIPAEVTRGFVMPEGDVIEGSEAYRIQQGDEEVIGWYIQTTLRQLFDYTRYPFDRQDIWLRLWHKDFARNVVLVPDFAGYQITTWDPFANLGLEKDFVWERLMLERTYFNYHYNSYNTNFGINNYVGQNEFPELYYNIGVRRDALDAFVAYLIPLLILVLMAFGVQFIITQVPEKIGLYGITTTGLIAYFASLFFIGILSQLDIRRTLNAPGVVYLEYFYFTLYIILLLQTVNAIIFIISDNVHFLEFKDNLYPKVIFFPITFGVMFIITATVFF